MLEEFEKWWKLYPRKLAKGDARKAWKQTAKIRPPMEKLVRALIVARASEQWTRDGGQYIPYPATWLRGERWDDVHEVDMDAVKDGKAWQESVSGIETKGKELGLEWIAGSESFQQYAKRVRDAVDRQKVVQLKAAT